MELIKIPQNYNRFSEYLCLPLEAWESSPYIDYICGCQWGDGKAGKVFMKFTFETFPSSNGFQIEQFMYLSIFCNKRAKRNNRVSLTKCMWDSCEKVAERKVVEKMLQFNAILMGKKSS